jgi:TP901 family phage tail tape measure protein|nr:MAG TPA_asm: minor tail protein [Caudoviricetes sp.]
MAFAKKVGLDVVIGGKVSSSLDTAFGKAASQVRTGLAKATTKAGKAAAISGALGPLLTKGITVPTVAALGASVKATVGFDKQMSRVKAISGATGKQFKALRKDAIKLGADTAYSSTEAAEGMENLASAGFNSKQIMAAMPGMLNLAAASGEDLATSSDIAASALRGFGLKASSAGHVANVLAKNASKTNAAVGDTGEALKYVAPVAHSAGLSLEEVTAAIGIMSNAGIKGTQAGTTLRGAMTRIMKPTKQVRDGLDKLGVSLYDKHGKMLSLTQIIGKLKTATKGMTDEEKQNALANIFGTNSLSGMLALVNAGPKELDKLTKSYKHSSGYAKKTAAEMMNNLAGAWEQMKGSLESAGISIGDALSPGLTALAKTITKVVNAFNELPESAKHVIAWAMVIAAAIGPAMVAFSKCYKAAKDLMELKAALSGLSLAANPVAAAIIGIGVAVGLLAVLIYKNRKKIAASWGKVKKGLGELGANTKKDLAAMGKHIAHWAEGWKTNAGKIKKSWAGVKKGLSTLGTNTKAGLASMKKHVVAWARGWKTNAGKIKKSMANVRKGTAQLKKNAVHDISAMVAKCRAKFSSFRASAGGLVSYIKGAFLKKWNSAWHAAGSHFASAWSGMKSAAKSAMNWIIGKINGFIRSVNSIHVPNSKLVPKGLRGASLHISTIPYLAKGTANWPGGPAIINERAIGGEIVDLPSGTRVIPHDLSKQVIKNSSSSATVTYAPVYNLYGNATANDIRKADQMSQKDFEKMLKRYQHDKQARSFRKVVFE